MKTRNKYEALQAALIEDDNVNVGKTSDLKNFFILIGGIVCVVFAIFIFSDFIANVFIALLPDEMQMKIERALDIGMDDINNSEENIRQLAQLNIIKSKIIKTDSGLTNKSDFPIFIIDKDEVNAVIIPNGKIFVTKGTLEQGYNEQELCFILAHEIGHYAHRDHLKAISRQILMSIIYSFISGENYASGKFISQINNLNYLSHSRKQEREADKYAGEALIKIYGTNNGGKSFILKIKEKENYPDFIHYFSSHPSWNDRLKLLEKQH